MSVCTKEYTLVVADNNPCPAATLLAYYKCDDVGFPVVESVSAKNMTTVAGSPFPQVEPGIINTGFFGIGGALATGFWMRNTDAQWDLSAETCFTIRAWFWYSGVPSSLYNTTVGSSGLSYGLIMFTPLLGLEASFKFQVGAQSTIGPIANVGWNRVIGIARAGVGLWIKVNNNPSNFFPGVVIFPVGTNRFELQAPNTVFPYPKTGIDEVAVWRGGLSDSQMTADWNGGAGLSYPAVLGL